MRVLLVIHSIAAGGGAERTTAGLARSWDERGWQVRIATFAAENEASNNYQVPSSVRIHALDLSERKAGILLNVVKYIRRIAALRDLIRKFEPNIVIGMMPPANTAVAIAAVGIKCTTIGCERTFPPLQPLGAARDLVRRITYGLLDIVTAQTIEAASWIAKHTLAKRTFVVPNAVQWPLARSSPTAQATTVIARDREVILAVGRLAGEKRFDRLIHIFAQISKTRPHIHLAIVGEGLERSTLQQMVGTLGLSDLVSLPGHSDDLGEWYERASIFALTSDYEGFPNVLLEAMSYGVPAVSFNCDAGPRDIIRDGVDGFLIPVDDINAFKEKLTLLVDDRSLRLQMAQAAKNVRDRFSSGQILKLWDETFSAAGCLSTRARDLTRNYPVRNE